MSNPFEQALSNMDGVTFNSTNFGTVTPGGDWAQLYPGFFYGTGHIPAVYGVASGSFADPGQVHVVNNTYIPAGYTGINNDVFHTPVFGQITLSNVSGNFFIVGIGDDGKTLLLYNDQNGPIDGVIPMSELWTNAPVYLLSVDQLPVNDGTQSALVFSNQTSAISQFASVVCFAEGTTLCTRDGAVAVEELTVGTMVVTAEGKERPIKWIGQTTARPVIHPRPDEVNPVRVKADAFGPGVPRADIRLSPGHAVFVDGVLVPVGKLVNGATVTQEKVDQIRYFHVELESHDLLLAEGMPCESYLDDGNRRTFRNAGGATMLHGRLDPKSWDDACAPVVADGPQLVAIQQRLHARAEDMGWTKVEDPDLRIVAAGETYRPCQVDGARHLFSLPAVDGFELRSNRGVLAQLMPGISDARALGVAVKEMRINGVEIDLASDAFGKGFFPPERHGGQAWRWTDGAATVSRLEDAIMTVELVIMMVAPSWSRTVADLRAVA